jgi:hypothetical protein
MHTVPCPIASCTEATPCEMLMWDQFDAQLKADTTENLVKAYNNYQPIEVIPWTLTGDEIYRRATEEGDALALNWLIGP